MDSARLTYLFHRYINQTCTEAERIEFLKMINEPDYEVQVKDLMKSLWNTADETERMSFARTEKILADILGDEEKVMVKHSSASSRWGKAVALAACILVGVAGIDQQDLESLGPIDEWHAEWKWDGIRAQLIRREGRSFIWSRGEDLITHRGAEYYD